MIVIVITIIIIIIIIIITIIITIYWLKTFQGRLTHDFLAALTKVIHISVEL